MGEQRLPLRHEGCRQAGDGEPKKSFTWLEKMMMAMPAVKPVTTGSGM